MDSVRHKPRMPEESVPSQSLSVSNHGQATQLPSMCAAHPKCDRLCIWFLGELHPQLNSQWTGHAT